MNAINGFRFRCLNLAFSALCLQAARLFLSTSVLRPFVLFYLSLSLSLFVPFSSFIFQRNKRRTYPDFDSQSSRGRAHVYRVWVHVRRVQQRVDQAKRIRQVYKGEYKKWCFVSRPSEISCIHEDGNPIGNLARENSEGYEALYTNCAIYS